MERRDVTFPSASQACAAWLYLPDDADRPPVVVMAHGLGAVKEMRLDAYAERFAAAGYACLVFDYRHFGASPGEPRQLLDIGGQLADWHAALAFARGLAEVDGRRIALFGTSFSGGHVLRVAADDGRVEAVIAQCPFTDGPASAAVADRRSLARVTALALADVAAAARGRAPVMVTTAGPPRSAALMTAPDCEPGYLALTPGADRFRNEVAARFGLALLRYVPGRAARRVTCPLYVALCDLDSVAPPRRALHHVAKAPRAEIRRYPVGHFDIYVGRPFERAVADYTEFLARQLPVAR